MSYDPCKYCDKPSFKTNGKSELICYNRANTGECETSPSYKSPNTIIGQSKQPRNESCKCGSGKKTKHCKCKK
jgi:hypothetical protein